MMICHMSYKLWYTMIWYTAIQSYTIVYHSILYHDMIAWQGNRSASLLCRSSWGVVCCRPAGGCLDPVRWDSSLRFGVPEKHNIISWYDILVALRRCDAAEASGQSSDAVYYNSNNTNALAYPMLCIIWHKIVIVVIIIIIITIIITIIATGRRPAASLPTLTKRRGSWPPTSWTP